MDGIYKDHFDALYDAAQEARAQIAAAIKTSDDRVITGTQFCALHVGDTVNFRAYLCFAAGSRRPDVVEYATQADDRDCTVEEIRDCAARVVAKLAQSAREAQIERLEAQLAKLKAEGGADNGK